MKSILKTYIINTSSIYLLTIFIPAVTIKGGFETLLYASLILSILNNLISPVINIIMFPINLLTLNITAWILNIVMIYVWTLIVRSVIISSWSVSSFRLGPLFISPFILDPWQVLITAAVVLIILIKIIGYIMK